MQRLRTRRHDHGGGLFDGEIAEALKTAKKSNWQACRAALLYFARRELEDQLAQQDKIQRACKAFELTGGTAPWESWTKRAELVEQCTQAIEAVLAASLPIDGRVNRHTKRHDMAGLPPDWRERVIARMATYRAAAHAAAVTGCRPAELVAGVQLRVEGGRLVALVIGAKVEVAGGKGQEWRRLEWPIDHPSVLVGDLAAEVTRASGSLLVAISNASNFSKSMSNAAAREWPKRKTTVTPYCFRHQVAADMKADGQLDSGEISAALGHLSDATKSTYGHANMCKVRGVAPAHVTAARQVKAKPAANIKQSVRKTK